jgi:hypothetical protein
MPVRPPLRASVSRHEDKEQRLRQFVHHHLSMASVRAHQLLVVARSLDSPVVKAIVGLEQAITAVGGSVRLILAQVDDEAQCLAGSAMSCKHEIRWARHPRLIEAHEQLVLGPQTCWIGDVEDCGEAAGCAAVSFERLWFASAPLNGAAPTAATAALLPLPAVSQPDLPGRH